MSTTLIRLDIILPEESLDLATGLLALKVPFGWEEESLPTGDICLRVHCDNVAFMETLHADIRASLPDAQFERSETEQQDWLAAWRDFFTPVIVGQHFMVLPPWLKDSTDLQGRHAIIIEPKSAFGTGHHPTTALCLGVVSTLASEGRIKAGQTFLDLGTGSGILAIGCAKLGLTGFGTDIDPLSIENSNENRVINNVADAFTVDLGSTEIVRGNKYDVVLANILAQPLKDLAADITSLVAQGGCLILSGLLEVQADGVEAAYHAQGLGPARRIVDGDWAALVWE
ncbi:MAG: 50S ribosomal protein L11 methyltransferase [Pseudomonadota bacterium]